ncbi:MAG: intradiol ring-cleavage dioxygenase [Anaerolineae bacterium]|nr:intradiol ring-cleavage dioxygenase [Anaerolineae bacterium]MCO5205223.1 intradiol ring-cleavage dioxygenase [Anaerolineae bacterium]
MDNDDRTIGRILTRREALKLLGAAGLAALVSCTPDMTEVTATLPPEGATAINPTVQANLANEVATAEAVNTVVANIPNCVVQPEVTEGPYYVDINMLRQDITEGKEGIPLMLTFNVTEVSADGCVPMQNALVEIWHCDKDGVYSGVNDPGFDTTGQTWLRGAQTTDANGNVTFKTIFPGWYSSRCIHIHFKVHPTGELEFTSQLFFPDAFNNQIVTQAPYAKGVPDTTNARDNIYQDSLLASATESDDGVTANFALGIDLSTVGTGSFDQGPRPPAKRG